MEGVKKEWAMKEETIRGGGEREKRKEKNQKENKERKSSKPYLWKS